MTSEGPISLSRRSSVAFANDPTTPAHYPDKRRPSASVKGLNQTSLPTFSDFSKTASVPNSPMVGPGTPSSHGHPLHTLYPNSTPPMSPAVMLSPVSRPNSHYGITDPSHYSTNSFYQLPPPLQPGEAREPGASHRSPAMHPQSMSSPASSSVHPLHPIQLPPLSPLTIASSPRSTPQLHMSQSYGSSHHSHSHSHSQHNYSSASGTISPYPTPQHHPQNFSSPHQSPHHERILPKQTIPAMNLPASALATPTSAFQVGPSRPSLSSYPSDIKKGPSSIFGGAPTPPCNSNSNSSNSSNNNNNSPFTSPRTNAVDSNRSAPGSPQRYMMLPPQSGPNPGLSLILPSSANSTVPIPPASSPVSGSGRRHSQGKKTSGSTSKRRSSSGAKTVDQETRDIMRKVSHSAIERRRRERINDKILQLKHLVPSCIDEDHLHKLSILQSTIEYIQHLKAYLPDSVVNSPMKKATNNNPNNKTTDMLEAMGGMLSTRPQQLKPMLTTGLGLQQKQQKQQKQHASYPLYASPSTSVARAKASKISSATTAAAAARRDSDAFEPSSKERPALVHRKSSSSYSSSSSSHSASSDEDAKEGLLMLSGAMENHRRPLRATRKNVVEEEEDGEQEEEEEEDEEEEKEEEDEEERQQHSRRQRRASHLGGRRRRKQSDEPMDTMM
ncbi:hypothetical protein BGZ94_002836 [Podila epigama]|nr:hypothetical protein BGZ94_002836 [Podila epigama]